jgi:NAD(P)-dependent dehydrogenase (short-subunit alcohol dehydrogenase family)
MTRRIIVTGAGRGIGLGIAKQLIAEGHEVWGTARHPENAKELRDAGAAGVLTLDIGDVDSIQAFGVDLATHVDSIDTLINNAGMTSAALGVDRRAQGPLQTTKEVVMRQIEVNAVGPMLVTQAVRPLLGSGVGPVVLNISSQLGSMVVGAQMPSDVGYNSSKSVMNMVTVMSATADPDVTYVAIHPGWVQSDMGGPKAALSIDESSQGIVSALNTLGPTDTGRFIKIDGNDHPW